MTEKNETTKPTSEEIHDWINSAYRQPPGYGPMDNDGSRFTRWNMEVAFAAGWDAAMKEIRLAAVDAPCRR
jgi:hypothetical protein